MVMGETWTILDAYGSTGADYTVAIDTTGVSCANSSQSLSLGQWHELFIQVGGGKFTCAVVGGGSTSISDAQSQTFGNVTLTVEGSGTAASDFVYNVDDVLVTSP
jgi:hypothetical protein